MQATSPIPKHSVGRTFTIAISILGIVALIELGAVLWIFQTRDKTLPPAQTLELPAELSTLPESTVETVKSPPIEEVTQTKPTPIPLKKHQSMAETRTNDALRQAQVLRERGDMQTALTRLREAQTLSPNNAQIIWEIAATYEKMGLLEKAREQWERIYKIGESAGTYYFAAEAKLNAGTASGSRTENASGFQTGSILALMDITAIDDKDPSYEKKFTLRVPLKAKPNTDIDVHDVTIQVMFYDILNNQTVVQTNADVSYQWSTVPANWTDNEIEILEADYSRSKEASTENRVYYGYVVSVYYKSELQDNRAEPVQLLKEFAPPITLDNR